MIASGINIAGYSRFGPDKCSLVDTKRGEKIQGAKKSRQKLRMGGEIEISRAKSKEAGQNRKNPNNLRKQ